CLSFRALRDSQAALGSHGERETTSKNGTGVAVRRTWIACALRTTSHVAGGWANGRREPAGAGPTSQLTPAVRRKPVRRTLRAGTTLPSPPAPCRRDRPYA